MKVQWQETLIVDGKHALFLTDEDITDFNAAASCINRTLDKQEILTFLAENIHLYYQGKTWGFNETQTREDICEELEVA